MTDFAIVLTTLPPDADADTLARRLVEERLAACVSVLPPMTSTYRWKGSVETAAERQVVIKTRASLADALQRRIAELHPYDVPELLTLPLSGGGAAYLDWLASSTSSDAGG